jgi:hypothetical protein
MNSDDFEKRLQHQPVRQVPPEWRAEILSAAHKAAPFQHATRNTHRSLLSTLGSQLSAILWPRPVAWAGLAAVWLVIAGLNVATRQASPRAVHRTSPLSPQVLVAFQEQARLLAELIGPREAPVAERPKPVLPRPRSERQPRLLCA